MTSNGNFQFIDSVSSGNTSLSPFSDYENRLVFQTENFVGDIDNVSLYVHGYTGETVTYNEKSKGWVSFKSFVPEFGLSCVNQYYTMNLGQLWKHHQEFELDGVTVVDRNTFYGIHEDSSVRPMLNMQPDLVKNFNTLKYEGSQSRVDQFLTHDVIGDVGVAIGDNLVFPLDSFGNATSMQVVIAPGQAPNSNVSFTGGGLTNNVSIVDLHGEQGLSDVVQINILNLDTTKTYRLSFDFSVTGASGQSHVYFGSTTISPVLSTTLSGGVFSEDFTPTNTTESINIVHPHLLNGFTHDVDVDLTNIIVQELDFIVSESEG